MNVRTRSSSGPIARFFGPIIFAFVGIGMFFLSSYMTKQDANATRYRQRLQALSVPRMEMLMAISHLMLLLPYLNTSIMVSHILRWWDHTAAHIKTSLLSDKAILFMSIPMIRRRYILKISDPRTPQCSKSLNGADW